MWIGSNFFPGCHVLHFMSFGSIWEKPHVGNTLERSVSELLRLFAGRMIHLNIEATLAQNIRRLGGLIPSLSIRIDDKHLCRAFLARLSLSSPQEASRTAASSQWRSLYLGPSVERFQLALRIYKIFKETLAI